MACLCRLSWASWIRRLWGKEGGEVQMAPAQVPRRQVRRRRLTRPLQRARQLKPILFFQLACLSSAASPLRSSRQSIRFARRYSPGFISHSLERGKTRCRDRFDGWQ